MQPVRTFGLLARFRDGCTCRRSGEAEPGLVDDERELWDEARVRLRLVMMLECHSEVTVISATANTVEREGAGDT
jgi:hypothetical protein